MPSSTALLSYGVALSCFAASVSGANAVPARDGFRRVMRRQSHGIELAADELVARDLGSNSGEHSISCLTMRKHCFDMSFLQVLATRTRSVLRI